MSLILRAALAAFVTSGLLACGSAPPLRPPGALPPGASQPPPRERVEPARPPALFLRPAPGPTIGRFDGQRNKGIDIAGNPGDPVLAAADGRVVYVGGELRGYGNMVIVKHNETFLTAYAHNRNILVKEKDVVRQGQQIAEMGSSGAQRVMLHFEIRRRGVAVDPEPYLSGELR